jgi:hypothetical protein
MAHVLGVDNNDDEPNDKEEGTNNDNTTASNKSLCGSKNKVVIVGLIAVLAIVAIIVGVAVATSLNSQQNASESQSSTTVKSSSVDSPTAPPTQTPMVLPTLLPTVQWLPVEPQTVAPTQSPTLLPTLMAAPTSATLPDLIELLSLVSPDRGDALRTPLMPQNNSVKWLANNSNFTQFSNTTKIQRYALGVLYYSTNGTNWSNKTGWLTDANECDWYHDPTLSFCDNGTIVGLDLYKDGSGNNLVGTIPMELALLSDSVGELSLVLSVVALYS